MRIQQLILALGHIRRRKETNLWPQITHNVRQWHRFIGRFKDSFEDFIIFSYLHQSISGVELLAELHDVLEVLVELLRVMGVQLAGGEALIVTLDHQEEHLLRLIREVEEIILAFLHGAQDLISALRVVHIVIVDGLVASLRLLVAASHTLG